MNPEAYRSGKIALSRIDDCIHVLTITGLRLNRAIGEIQFTRRDWEAANVKWQLIGIAMHRPVEELPHGVRFDADNGRLLLHGTELSLADAVKLTEGMDTPARLMLDSHRVPNLTVLQDKLLHVLLHAVFTMTRASAVVIEGQTITLYNTRMALSPLMRLINRGMEVFTTAIQVTLAEETTASAQ